MARTNRRGVILLPLAIVVAGLILAIGLTTAGQITAAMRTMDGAWSRRLLEIVEDSTLTEARLAFDTHLQEVISEQVASGIKPWEIKRITWQYEPRATTQTYAPCGFEISTVQVTTTDFVAPSSGNPLDGGAWTALGVVQFEYDIQRARGGCTNAAARQTLQRSRTVAREADRRYHVRIRCYVRVAARGPDSLALLAAVSRGRALTEVGR